MSETAQDIAFLHRALLRALDANVFSFEEDGVIFYDSCALSQHATIMRDAAKVGLFEITLEAPWRYIKGRLTTAGKSVMANAMREDV